MVVGVYDSADGTAEPKMYPTQQAMLEDWVAGRLSGVVDTVCPAGGTFKSFVADSYIIAIDSKVTDGSFAGRTMAASPEQRDILAQQVAAAGQVPSDIALLTQDQYLADPTCADIFITAVRQPSSFLTRLQRPFYVRQLSQAGKQFAADQLPGSYNVKPVQADSVAMNLYARVT